MVSKQTGEIMTSKNAERPIALKQYLEQYERSGIKLYLNGVPSNTEFIVSHCVNEDTVYMPDYVTDESGKVKEIRYDRISGK